MATTIPIPARTIPAGQSVLGPVSPDPGCNGFTMVFDVGALVDAMTLTFRYAEDGVTFRTLSIEGPLMAGCAKNRDGTARVPPNMEWSPNLGTFGDTQNLTVAGSKVEILVDNATAWRTTGGTITPF